jgi:F-type H+-transporting ATPase subunit b
MPQLDVTTFPSQLFWLGVSFIVLYLVLSYMAVPKIVRILGIREETIEEKINTASTYREEAESLLNEYETALAVAKAEAQEHTQTISQKISRDIAKKKKNFLSKLTNRLHREEQSFYRTHMETPLEMDKLAAEIASLILEKVTGTSYSPKKLLKNREKI